MLTPEICDEKWILAIDPGSDKVGYAVVYYNLEHGEMGIAWLTEMQRVFRRFCSGDLPNRPQAVVIGNGTAAAVLCRLYNDLGFDLPVYFAEEKNTTYKARARYFQENPPTGLWHFVPLGLQVPPCPLDDYAAWLIGEKYLFEHKLSTIPSP
ncbi:MAG: hypothetical protein EOM80_06300 [Erysipelotrichia bacterium]|nr:hypothetical protein [Erysipelotrichia bacterium]